MSDDRPQKEKNLHRLFDPFFFLCQHGLPVRAYDDPWSFYLENALQYPDCDPHPLFETRCYLESWPGLESSGVNPLLHYLGEGSRRETSRPNRLFNQRHYLKTQCLDLSPDLTPLEHYELFSGITGVAPDPNRVIKSNYFNVHNRDLVGRNQTALSYLLRYSRGEPRLFSNRISDIATKILNFHEGPLLDNYRPIRCLILDFESAGSPLESGSQGDLAALLRHLTESEDASKFEFVAITSAQRRRKLPARLRSSVVRLEKEFGETDPRECPAEIASFLRSLASPFKETLVFSSHPKDTPTLDGPPVHPLSQAGHRLGEALEIQSTSAASRGHGDPKIIFPITDWQISGVNTWVAELSTALARRGWNVELLSSRPFHRHTQGSPLPPLPLKCLDVPPSKPEWWWPTVRDYLNSQSPAVILTAYDFHFNSLASVAGEGIASIGVLHSDDPVYYEQCQRLGPSWHHIITVSDHIRKMVRERFPEHQQKTTTIHYGIPRWEGERPAPPSSDLPLRLIYTGRIAHLQKRLLDLPHFFDALEKRGVPFHATIIGEGLDRDDLELELALRIARDQVKFTGRLSSGEIHQELARSHVFFLISDFEGLSLSLLEAMSHGTVPVVSDIDSGIPEVIHEGETGFRVPVGNYAAFAEVLHRLWSQPSVWEKVSRKTRDYFERELTVDVMANRTEALIRQLWSTGPPARPAILPEPSGEPETAGRRFGGVPLPPKLSKPEKKP